MNEKLMVTAKTQIYICCPCLVTSGGPEALHQLYFYMKKSGLNCYLAYMYSGSKTQVKIADRYKIYAQEYILYEDIEDIEDNVIIMPESFSIRLQDFFHVQKCIWWLSVLFADSIKKYDRRIIALIKDIINPIENYSRFKMSKKFMLYQKHKDRFKDIRIHFAGSKFAYEYLKNQGYNNIEYLVEPISKPFLDAGKFSSNSKMRNDIILYNPAKNLKTINQLLKFRDFNFVPLKGYSCEELIKLYRTSKVYIDFGGFPGPERIPKETVYNGCIILVGKENAAINDFDIAIPEEYKIAKDAKVNLIINNIRNMLEKFDEVVNDFLPFQNKIENLESSFINQIICNFK